MVRWISQKPPTKDRQHHEIHDAVVGQVEQAEQATAGDALHAVFAAREGHPQPDEIHHLRERQRDHRKVDALAANRQNADQQPQQRREGGAGQKPELGREAQGLHRIAGDVAGAAQKSGMAERQQTGVADQQVEGAGKQREAQQFHEEHRVLEEGRRQRQREHQRVTEPVVGQKLHFSLPNKPAGRNTSTTAITTNTTVAEPRVEDAGEAFDHAQPSP